MIQNSSSSHLAASWLVIVNPMAGNGTLQNAWPELSKKLALVLPQMKVEMSPQFGSATALVAEATAKGIRHVMAVGGDGTAHQVINGICKQKSIPTAEIIFALLPFGTGNDWIKTHGIPREWKAWLNYFKNAVPEYQNLGEIDYFSNRGAVEKRYFMNVAGLAYDAFVAHFTAGKNTVLPGKLFYLWATFRCLFQYTPQRGILRYNDKTVEKAFYTINIGICRYSGGGMQLVPHAKASGANMALTYIGKVSRLAVLLNSFRFYEGRIAAYRQAVLDHTSFIKITPTEGQTIWIEADGEFLGSCPVTLKMIPQALCFLAPKK